LLDRQLSAAEEVKITQETLQQLNAEAEKDIPIVDNKVGVNVYYHMAQQFWEQVLASKYYIYKSRELLPEKVETLKEPTVYISIICKIVQ
jgi:hypothetical protein